MAIRQVRLWNSKAWMTRQYVALGKSPAKIAEEAGCTQMTVYRKLRELGLLK